MATVLKEPQWEHLLPKGVERYFKRGASRDLARHAVTDLRVGSLAEASSFYGEMFKRNPTHDDLALLGLIDRWYLFTGILNRRDALQLGGPRSPDAAEWLYNRCREVEIAPDGYLDLWARESYKSSLITFAGGIQEILRNPEITIGIFSHIRPLAKDFQRQIKQELERNDTLKTLYADVLYAEPRRQSPKWSEDDGLIVKRTKNPKEATLEAWGLVDGMPTGKHYMLRIYDDIITEKAVTTPDMVSKVIYARQLSDNLGTIGGREWNIGTRYCLTGDARVLMADWSHKPIQDVRKGDVVIGWELRDGTRWLRPAKVKARGMHLEQKIRRYEFSNGRAVTCTLDHLWWRGPHGSGAEYKRLGLRYHDMGQVRCLLDPIERDNTWDAGWLAGFFDGEGTIKKNKNHPSAAVVLTQSMHNPEIVEYTREALGRLNFAFREKWVSPADRWNDRCDFIILGGWRERYRFLIQVAPQRNEKLTASLFGQLKTHKIKLRNVVEGGNADVYWIETETGNYVAEGFCSKNSFGDPYQDLIDRKVVEPRVYPATINGRWDGASVFLSEKSLEDKRMKQPRTFASQMLQNPAAGEEAMFQVKWLKWYEVRPATLNIYILCDPSKGRTDRSDYTAMSVVGLDAARNRYLLDGYRQRMNLQERWVHLRDLYKKWSEAPGVNIIRVGYEHYGMQADIEHFQEMMRIEGEESYFPIEEVAWPRDNKYSKEDRVGRLVPDFKQGRFFLSAVVHVPGRGECSWCVIDEEIVLIDHKKPTRVQKRIIEAGQPFRVAKAIKRMDRNNNVYDLTRCFIDEYLFFPFGAYKDLIDATSRVYDVDGSISPPEPEGDPNPQAFPDT